MLNHAKKGRCLFCGLGVLCSCLCFCLWVSLCLSLCGCAGYQLGNQTLFPADIRTVGVDIVGNETWRRGYGERLTEALVREIESRTPYKVVPSSRADTVLKVKIVQENKSVTFQNDWADPRELALGMTVEAQWIDRRTQDVRQSQHIDMGQEALKISATTPLLTEFGQSNATSSQTLLQNLAQHIVGMMESPW